MNRVLVLFAREPAREAREKGFASPEAAGIFAAFARRWMEAAVSAGARYLIAAPAEDLAAWRRHLPAGRVGWIAQRGGTFGDRLHDAALRAGGAGDRVVLVGGDVAPDAPALARAFEALAGGADAVISPAPDGGISLLALDAADRELLRAIELGSASGFEDLLGSLEERGGTVVVLDLAPDVDRRRDLRRLLRRPASSLPASAVRRALEPSWTPAEPPPRVPRDLLLSGPSGLRAPPVSA